MNVAYKRKDLCARFQRFLPFRNFSLSRALLASSWLPLGSLLPSSVYLGEASNNLHIHGAIDLEENGRLSTTAEMYRPATKDRQRQMEDEFKKNESINTKTSTENNERHDLIWCDMNGGDKSTCQVSLMFPSCLPHIVYNSTIM